MSVRIYYGVYRAQKLRSFVHLVKVRNNRLFVRRGNVHSAYSESAYSFYRVLNVSYAPRRINVVVPGDFGNEIVHNGRKAVIHRIAYYAELLCVCGCFHAFWSLSFYFLLRAVRCGAYFLIRGAQKKRADCRSKGRRRICILRVPEGGEMRRLFLIRGAQKKQADCRSRGRRRIYILRVPESGEMRRLFCAPSFCSRRLSLYIHMSNHSPTPLPRRCQG